MRRLAGSRRGSVFTWIILLAASTLFMITWYVTMPLVEFFLNFTLLNVSNQAMINTANQLMFIYRLTPFIFFISILVWGILDSMRRRPVEEAYEY